MTDETQNPKPIIPPGAVAVDASETKTESPKPAISGEIELPHQKNEFKPDEIVEFEQEPPREIISADDRQLASLHSRVNSAFSLLKEEEERLQELKNKRESIEKKLEDLKNLVSDPVKNQIGQNSLAGGDSDSLNAKFLQKLSFLRKAAREKRSIMVEANLNKIAAFAKEYGRVTNDEVEAITGVKDSRAREYLNRLLKERRLLRYGRGRYTYYKTT